jgi:hypothetical protein
MTFTEKVVLITLVAIVVFVFISRTNLVRASKWASLIQALVTSGAILVGGAWYLVERQPLPHADVSQTINVVPVDKGLIAVEAQVTIKNLGRRLLKIRKIDAKLQAVSAKSFDYRTLTDHDNDSYWSAKRPEPYQDDDQFHFAELRWPILRRFNREVQHDIEAGESDVFVATFLMRCPAHDFVRVATEVYNPTDFKNEGLTWKARSFANVGDVCRSK